MQYCAALYILTSTTDLSLAAQGISVFAIKVEDKFENKSEDRFASDGNPVLLSSTSIDWVWQDGFVEKSIRIANRIGQESLIVPGYPVGTLSVSSFQSFESSITAPFMPVSQSASSGPVQYP